MIERKIGEVFELNGRKMKVVSQINDCAAECFLYKTGCGCGCDFVCFCHITGECVGQLRKDKTDVVFQEVKG